MKILFQLFFLSFISFVNLYGIPIKNIANIIGVRDNQLIGYGLVVGLNGTGDGGGSLFTTQALSNLLGNMNVKVDPTAIKSKNIAAVVVTAKLPPFSRQGDKIDILVSSIGDAKSIEGGTLLLTPLKGIDGKIYAVAQGAVAIGGFNAGGNKGQKNHTTVASIFNGGSVERELAFDMGDTKNAALSLKKANFQNAVKIQNALNRRFNAHVAQAIDPTTVKMTKPDGMSMVEFLSSVEMIEVIPEKEATKIVIDEKTGTIVAGNDIVLDPIVITHGDLTIKVKPKGSDPSFKGDSDMGDNVTIGTESNVVSMTQGQLNVSNLARALQKLGAKPKDIISIIQSIKKAGALNAELEIL